MVEAVSNQDTSAKKAAAGFLSDEVIPNKGADLEFFFTRSIEFRQETIYFIVVDRFFDGDSRNDQGQNPKLFDPTRQHWGKYWGDFG